MLNHKEQSRAALVRFGELRKAHQVTQVQIAERVGVKFQSVGGFERGRFQPTLDTVYKYLGALNELAGTGYSLKDLEKEG